MVVIMFDGGDEVLINVLVVLVVSWFGGFDGFYVNYVSFKDGESGEDIFGLLMEVFDEVMCVNVCGFVFCMCVVILEMFKCGGGLLVYMILGVVFMGEIVWLVYVMSKFLVYVLVCYVVNCFSL